MPILEESDGSQDYVSIDDQDTALMRETEASADPNRATKSDSLPVQKKEETKAEEERIVEDLSKPKSPDVILVDDWVKRFKLANYTAEQIRVVKKSQAKLKEYFDMFNVSDWSEQLNAKDGLKCWCRTSSNQLNMFKCQRLLPHNVNDVFETLLDDRYR